jgi:hypothetical protein
VRCTIEAIVTVRSRWTGGDDADATDVDIIDTEVENGSPVAGQESKRSVDVDELAIMEH